MFVKTFDHLEFPADRYQVAERVETDTMRLYRTPRGDLYPSVTTVLGSQPKPELEAWRLAVGEEEARRVSEHAAKRGTLLHDMAELYINNQLVIAKANPMILQDFLPIKKVLDERVNNIFHTELRLYSDGIKSAGTCDLVADYEGVQSLVDFKTSRRVKYESDIEDYFMQESAYCVMIFERFGIVIKDIVTIMMVDGDSKASVFKKKSVDYIDRYMQVRESFRLQHGI